MSRLRQVDIEQGRPRHCENGYYWRSVRLLDQVTAVSLWWSWEGGKCVNWEDFILISHLTSTVQWSHCTCAAWFMFISLCVNGVFCCLHKCLLYCFLRFCLCFSAIFSHITHPLQWFHCTYGAVCVGIVWYSLLLSAESTVKIQPTNMYCMVDVCLTLCKWHLLVYAQKFVYCFLRFCLLSCNILTKLWSPVKLTCFSYQSLSK